MATNNNDNNIYINILNKYKRENQKNSWDFIKTVSEMKQDENWDKLTEEEQQKLIAII